MENLEQKTIKATGTHKRKTEEITQLHFDKQSTLKKNCNSFWWFFFHSQKNEIDHRRSCPRNYMNSRFWPLKK